MKLKNNLLTLLCLSALPLTAQAITVPKCASRDCLIQQAVYSPNEVIHIRGKIGNASWIQLEPDERLVGDSSFLGLGDKQAWNLGIKGNNIVFKPTAKLPDTNLLIQTNKRSYAFSPAFVNSPVLSNALPSHPSSCNNSSNVFIC